MKLEQLAANDLAAIDSVCLKFESQLRSGQPVSVEEAVAWFAEQNGRSKQPLVPVLREELEAVAEELEQERLSKQRAASRAGVVPFQAKSSDQQPVARKSSGFTPTPEVMTPSSRSASPSRSGADLIATEWMQSAESSTPAETSAEHVERDADDLPSANTPDPSRRSPEGLSLPDRKTFVGPYQIERVLARGGMAVVYRARDTRLDREVAIKMLGFPHLSVDDPKRIELVERFEREAKAVAGLSHPHIVELFDVGVIDGVPYAVMELLKGFTLAETFRNGSLDPEQTRQLGMQIAGALTTAHAAGVIHRDLKPQNIMLVDDQDDDSIRVKLVDFGLSRVDDASGLSDFVHSDRRVANSNDGDATADESTAAKHDSDSAARTRQGMILGTPGYMAPEQARGEAATSAADVFGLGCVLFEAFYGRPAFPGQTPADRIAVTLKSEVDVDGTPCERSQRMCAVIADCLKKEPSQRPTAAEIYHRLRHLDTPERKRASLVVSSSEAEPTDSPILLRRHFLTMTAGGVLGGLMASFDAGNAAGKFASIERLSVLTFRNLNQSASIDRSGMPLAGRSLAEGEMIAAAIGNELSMVDGLIVLPYRPQFADSPDDFQQLGQQLDVDAFVTGSYREQTLGDRVHWELFWQLVSAEDGRVLHGEKYVTELANHPGDRLIYQSEVASEIASRIDRVLVPNAQRPGGPGAQAYNCLVKGRVQADADSIKGLREALNCFNHAYQEDGQRVVEPLAAIAVTSLMLAARSEQSETQKLMVDATNSMNEALRADPSSFDARLAQAMLEWQSLHHYEKAFELFERLDRDDPYHAQMQHQRGLLLATLGMADQALDALRTATRLHPMSILFKTDRCRVDWFFGYEDRAVRDATRYFEEAGDNAAAKQLASGLLIDIYEQRCDYVQAAATWGWVGDKIDRQEYFRLREKTLETHPYGPFGEVLNHAIMKLRRDLLVDESMPQRLDESRTPMFPLLLTRHLAFDRLRQSDAAAPFLPDPERISTPTTSFSRTRPMG